MCADCKKVVDFVVDKERGLKFDDLTNSALKTETVRKRHTSQFQKLVGCILVGGLFLRVKRKC